MATFEMQKGLSAFFFHTAGENRNRSCFVLDNEVSGDEPTVRDDKNT